MKIKLYYVIGVEGCGHHALTPAIHASFSNCMNTQGSQIEIHEPSIKLLNQAFCELWYLDHKVRESRDAIRNKIKAIVQALDFYAADQRKTQILIHDNSFPSVHRRSVEEQWDLVELAELLQPCVDLCFIALYRDPVATTYSHQEWDGGLRAHAQVVAIFLEYLNDKINELGAHDVKILHYEDLVNRTDELLEPISKYLEVDIEHVRVGFSSIRKSDKDWRKAMPIEDQRWITSFFDEQRTARWAVFLDPEKNLLS